MKTFGASTDKAAHSDANLPDGGGFCGAGSAGSVGGASNVADAGSAGSVVGAGGVGSAPDVGGAGEQELTARPDAGASFDSAPIGVFDSGYGGLTVMRELMRVLPDESIVYFGDTARCPYGPRELHEVDGFVQQIGSWLVERGVKLIVIACNTATAAGLVRAQQNFPVPVIGVVEPGARAAVHETSNRRIGVIGTKATITSGVYAQAIRDLDAGITVFSVPTPRFVEIAEQGIRLTESPIEDFTSQASKVYVRPAFSAIAREYLDPLKRCQIDTLVLGCTHFPLLKALIGSVIGREVLLISSAQEVARDVAETLTRRGMRAQTGRAPEHSFFTTGDDVQDFVSFGSRVLRMPIAAAQHVRLERLA